MANNTAQAIQKVYAPNFETRLKQDLILGNMCNREFEGLIKDGGETIKIRTESEVLLTDLGFDGGPVTYDPINIQAQELVVDQYPSVAFRLNATEQAQLKTKDAKEIIRKKTSRANYKFALHMEDNIASTYTDAGLVLDVSGINGGVITSTYANQVMNELSVLARENDLDVNMMDAVLPPWFVGRLELDTANVNTETGMSIRQNGWKGKSNGFNVYESNSIVEDASDFWYPIIAVRGEAIALAVQTEPSVQDATRPEYFEEAYKMLSIYGFKGYRSDKIMTTSGMKRA